MMKFFALVALTVFATANAGTGSVTWGTTTLDNLVAGATPTSLSFVITASSSGAIAHTTGTITVTPSSQIFAANGDTSCTATATTNDGTTAVGTEPTFLSGSTANKGVVSGTGSAQIITFTMGTTTASDILAESAKITITCTDNFDANAATALAITFSVETSGDTTAVTGAAGYTLKTTPTFTSAARATGTTTLMEGMAGGDLTMIIAPVTDLPAGGTITITPSAALFTKDGATTCTATNAAATNPTFASATVSGTSGTQIITFTLGAGATDVIATTIATTIVCTDNLAVNTAAAAITFSLVTSTDLNAVTGGAGYTIITRTCPRWTSASRASLAAGADGGALTVILTPTGNLANSGTIILTPSAEIFSADGDTSCTASTAETNNPAFISTLTGTAANKGVVSGTGTTQIITLTLAAGTDDLVAANAAITIVCTDNLAVNGAASAAITFGVNTGNDATDLAAQTGYTIDAATSAASATAGVSMLTMLALAGVAMRQ